MRLWIRALENYTNVIARRLQTSTRVVDILCMYACMYGMYVCVYVCIDGMYDASL